MKKINNTFESPAKIAESITSMRLSVLSEPTLTASTKADAYEKALEKMLEMKWKIMFEIHMKDQRTFDENWVKLTL